MPTKSATPWLQPFKYCRNGKYPDAQFQADMSRLANHVALWRMKEIASFGMTTEVLASDAGDRPRWRTRYEPSPYAQCIIVRAWLAQSEFGSHSVAPYATVTLDNGVDTGTCELNYGGAQVDNANPDHCAPLTGIMMNDATPTLRLEPTPGTVYEVTVSDIKSRIVAISIYEGLSSSAAIFEEGYAAQVPVNSGDRSEILSGARNMWKTQAAPLFTWTVDDQASPRTRTGATVTNLIDNTTTGADAAAPGFTIDLRNRARTSTGTVTVKFEVYAKTAAGSAGKCRLHDSSGTAKASITNISTTEGWYSVSAELPATLEKYDILYAGDGTNQVSVYAVRLTQYA